MDWVSHGYWNSKYLICERFDDPLPALPVLLGASVLSLCTFTGRVHVAKHRMSCNWDKKLYPRETLSLVCLPKAVLFVGPGVPKR